MRRPLDRPCPVPLGVNVGDVVLWQALGSRLGWSKRQRADAAKLGLKSAIIGRMKVTTGKWITECVERLAEQQAKEAQPYHLLFTVFKTQRAALVRPPAVMLHLDQESTG
jgi:hypothetical protein